MTDIDDQLRAYAQRWRTAQPPLSQPVLAGRPLRPRLVRFEHPGRLGAIAVTVAAVVAAGVVYAATRHPSTTVSTGGGAEVPVATPPLVFTPQPPPRLVNLANGPAHSIHWIFYAGYLPTETQTGLGPGLCLTVSTTVDAGDFGCSDPTTTPSLTANILPLKSDPSTLLIAGVTSAPAATFTVTLGTVKLSTPALTTTALQGLRLYIIAVPAHDYQPGRGITVEARAADGTPLLRNNPSLTATLPPAN